MIQDAYAPNTIRAYQSDMEEFIGYCSRLKARALPASPKIIAQFLGYSATLGIKSATVRRKVASISAVHRFSEQEDPTKHPQVKLAMRRIQRQLGTRFRQAYPAVTLAVLEKLLKACTNDPRGARNRALLMLAYSSMRRRSELVSLRLEDVDDLGAQAWSILLRRSKSDQEACGQWVHLDKQATQELKRWVKIAKIDSGFILRAIDPKGRIQEDLSTGQIGRIFKALAKTAGLADLVVRDITGHSMRVGSAQDLLRCGASLPQIMVKGGWYKTDTVMRYVERIRVPPYTTGVPKSRLDQTALRRI